MNDPYRTPAKDKEEEEDVEENRPSFARHVVEALVTIVAFGITVVALYSLVQITRADGKSDFCYVTPDTSGVYFTDKYRLTRHIPWRSDRVVLRNIATAEEARQEAVKFGCEIR